MSLAFLHRSLNRSPKAILANIKALTRPIFLVWEARA